MRGIAGEPGCVAGTSGSVTVPAASIRAGNGGAWSRGPPKPTMTGQKSMPTMGASKQAPLPASSTSAPPGNDAAPGAGGRTKAAARRARRKVLEERYASNTPELPPSQPTGPKSTKAAPSTLAPLSSTTAAVTAPNDTTTPDLAPSSLGVGLVPKKKKTRRSGVKARRRIENAQNREVEAVEAALDELDLHGSDSEEEDVREYFRTNKCSPVKSKSIPVPPPSLPPSTAPSSPLPPSLAAPALSPPRATPGLRPLRTPFAARSTALAAATASLASTPYPTPLPLRAPAFPSGARLAPLGVAASLDPNPFASRVGLTPRLPSPSPATAAMFRPTSPAPASPASSLGMKMAWEEGSSYLSNDMSFDISTGASSPTASALAREEDLELDLSADNTRDEILSVDEDHDTTLDEDEVDELSVLGMEEEDSLEDMTVSMRVLGLVQGSQSQEQGQGQAWMSMEEAKSIIDSFLSDTATFTAEGSNKLRLWQALCIELGLVDTGSIAAPNPLERVIPADAGATPSPSPASTRLQTPSDDILPPLPTTLRQASLLLRNQAHINLSDYLSARAATPGGRDGSFRYLLYPSSSALRRHTRKEGTQVTLQSGQEVWLQPLLKDFGYKRGGGSGPKTTEWHAM